MVRNVRITLDDDSFEKAEKYKNAHNLTWAQMLLKGAEITEVDKKHEVQGS